MEKISVIIPVYNVGKVLKRCIDSVIAQDYKNMEIIIVDDGSSDNSGKLCDEYAEKDFRIKVIHQNNQGVSAARNVGIENAEGTYVSFIDSDDSICPHMYSELIDIMEENNLDLITFRAQRIKGNKIKRVKFTGKLVKEDTREAVRECLINEGGGAWSRLYKRNVIGNIRFPVGRKFEDTAIMFKLLANAKNIGFIDKVYYNYYYNMQSITQSAFNVKDRWDYVLSCEDAYKYAVKNNYDCVNACNSNLIKSLLSCLTACYATGSIKDKEKYLPLIKNYIEKYRVEKSDCRMNYKYKLFLWSYNKMDFIHIISAKLSLYFKKIKKL